MLSLFGSKARSAFKNLSIEKLSIFLVEKMSKILMTCIQTDLKSITKLVLFHTNKLNGFASRVCAHLPELL